MGIRAFLLWCFDVAPISMVGEVLCASCSSLHVHDWRGKGWEARARLEGGEAHPLSHVHVQRHARKEVSDSGSFMGRWSQGQERACACSGGTGREQSNRLEKVTRGGEERGLQLVPDALRS